MALLFALLIAALPVRPVADAAKLPAELGQGKPVLLHFWATWCEACREEFPKLKSTLLALPAQGVAVGLVSIDQPQQAEAAQQMLEKFGLAKLPSVLLDAPSPEPVAAAVGEPKWDGALPATFLFDARGKLVKSYLGQAPIGDLKRRLRKLRATSGTKPPVPAKD
jgi:thiol-disulfide isomerase/thioredoxin